jgi:hypothetical protein
LKKGRSEQRKDDEGRKEGKKEGKKEGRKEGTKEGINQGTKEGRKGQHYLEEKVVEAQRGHAEAGDHGNDPEERGAVLEHARRGLRRPAVDVDDVLGPTLFPLEQTNMHRYLEEKRGWVEPSQVKEGRKEGL